MKLIFQTMPAYGHLNPMLGVAKKLIQDGHEVVVCNTVEFKEMIEKVGARFRGPPVGYKPFDLRSLRNASHIAEQGLIASRTLAPYLVDIIREEKPDCLVHDSLSVWGKVAGIITHTPSVSLVPSMAINTNTILRYTKYLFPDYVYQMQHLFETINIFRQHRLLYSKIPSPPPFFTDMFANKEPLNIVFTSDLFQPVRKSFDESYKFVGPVIYDRFEDGIPNHLFHTKTPVIYVALGTIYNDKPAVYKTLIHMFKDKPYQGFISIGKNINSESLGSIPKNVYIGKHLPQLEMLKKADLFISHGGMNSVNESIYFGVPMLLIPHIQEQRINADRVVELGAGICYLDKDVKEDRVLKYVKKILDNSSYKINAGRIGETLRKAGGAKKAVEHIYEFMKHKT